MPYHVLPLTAEDFPTLRAFTKQQDTFASPAVDVTFPQGTPEAAIAASTWSLQQQLDILQKDPTCTFLKAVDTETEEIASIARWHHYQNGYVPSTLEYAGLKTENDDSSYPVGLMKSFYLGVLHALFDVRNTWMGNGKFWILTTLKTRESQRRKGAGSALIEWGVKKAKEEGCPAFLEAAADATGLYQKHGFEPVEPIKVDLNPYGIPSEAVFMRMVANKQS